MPVPRQRGGHVRGGDRSCPSRRPRRRRRRETRTSPGRTTTCRLPTAKTTSGGPRGAGEGANASCPRPPRTTTGLARSRAKRMVEEQRVKREREAIERQKEIEAAERRGRCTRDGGKAGDSPLPSAGGGGAGPGGAAGKIVRAKEPTGGSGGSAGCREGRPGGGGGGGEGGAPVRRVQLRAPVFHRPTTGSPFSVFPPLGAGCGGRR